MTIRRAQEGAAQRAMRAMRDVFPGSLNGATPVADPFAPLYTGAAPNAVSNPARPGLPATGYWQCVEDSAVNTTRDYQWPIQGGDIWDWTANWHLADVTASANLLTFNTTGIYSLEASADIVGNPSTWFDVFIALELSSHLPWGRPNLAPSPFGSGSKTLTLTAAPWVIKAGTTLYARTKYQTDAAGTAAASTSLNTGTPSIRITRWS